MKYYICNLSNNGVGVEIFNHSQPSEFDIGTITGGEISDNDYAGVAISSSKDVQIKNVTFENNGAFGIVAENSSVTMPRGNNISNSPTGVWLGGTHPLASDFIVGHPSEVYNIPYHNVFHDLLVGVECNGVTGTTGINIMNNIFHDVTSEAILMKGANKFNIANNFIHNNEAGILASSPGNNYYNKVQCN